MEHLCYVKGTKAITNEQWPMLLPFTPDSGRPHANAQHTTPQVLLRAFCIDPDAPRRRRKAYCFNKADGTAALQAVASLPVSNALYNFVDVTSGIYQTLEEALSQSEGNINPILRELIDDPRASVISAARTKLAEFMALLLLRTPRWRETMLQMVKHEPDLLRDQAVFAARAQTDPGIPAYAHNTCLTEWPSSLARRSGGILMTGDDPVPSLWTSDQPVAILSSPQRDHTWQLGLGDPKDGIYAPLRLMWPS